MPLLPWRLVKTWSCILCGECCRKFEVRLLPHEAKRLIEKYGPEVVVVRKGKYYLKKVNGACIFQDKRICSIQGDKPMACRLWPFYVEKKPMRLEDRYLARFDFMGETYYVYVHSMCRGINKGITPVEVVIMEVISLMKRKTSMQILSTSMLTDDSIKRIEMLSKALKSVIIGRKLPLPQVPLYVSLKNRELAQRTLLERLEAEL
ncbi:MAG: YkgJ family cysteine cluster protein [Candidatus Baldrarchaeia archaeon]